jgi:hypothetical protein
MVLAQKAPQAVHTAALAETSSSRKSALEAFRVRPTVKAHSIRIDPRPKRLLMKLTAGGGLGCLQDSLSLPLDSTILVCGEPKSAVSAQDLRPIPRVSPDFIEAVSSRYLFTTTWTALDIC